SMARVFLRAAPRLVDFRLGLSHRPNQKISVAENFPFLNCFLQTPCFYLLNDNYLFMSSRQFQKEKDMCEKKKHLYGFQKKPGKNASFNGIWVFTLALLLVVAVGFIREVEAQTPTMLDPNLGVRTAVSGLTTPTAMAFLGNNDFFVIEKNTGSLALGGGISSASGLFGSVSYQQQNLGGNNQTLGGEVQLGTQALLLFDLRFTDPWIAGDPYRTSYSVNAFRRRSISLIFDGGEREIELENGDRPRVVRLGGGVTFTRPLSRDIFTKPEWTASLGLQYQRVSIRDNDGELSPEDELGNDLSFSGTGKDDLLPVQLGAARDRRNDPLRPTSGSLLRLGVEQSIPLGGIFLNRLRG
ncbi:MAG: BamA/TamA family outer membrane protein, partial [Microcoleus sp. T3-bin5]|nr:BamA/TamA family outer membrane protein [Microcoleus sp. T3-bin5]